MTWTAISGDLTRNDKTKQQSSGGPLTQDNTSVEYYDTVFALAESPVEKGLIWAGTDDGLVHLTRDAGQTLDRRHLEKTSASEPVSIIEGIAARRRHRVCRHRSPQARRLQAPHFQDH